MQILRIRKYKWKHFFDLNAKKNTFAQKNLIFLNAMEKNKDKRELRVLLAAPAFLFALP